jgi:hypothetical protein
LQKEAGFPAFAGMTMVESTWQAADGRIKSGHDVFFGVMRGLDPAHLLATGRWPGLRPAMTFFSLVTPTKVGVQLGADAK